MKEGWRGRAGRTGDESPAKLLKSLSNPHLFVQGFRLTYTFLALGEISSIHFDAERHEIFYNGHNLRNLKLTEIQKEALKNLLKKLHQDEKGTLLARDYESCLGRYLPSLQK
ncbi:MAG: hypothetical protein U1F57_02415 [bacterium]